jgi:hypothetical protein
MGGANGNGSEDQVWQALQQQLQPGETLLRNVRFSDPKSGDVEADFIILMPDAGVAIIEVKGGTVSYEDGSWTMRNGSYARRIHPTDQARRAKHALRRYLDRQPEWTHGLVRSAWLIALPFTDVTGDMGPEGKRAQLIGRGELDSIRERVRSVLRDPLNADPLPTGDWVEVAVSLLLRLEPTVESPTHRSNRFAAIGTGIALFAVAAVATAFATVRGGWLGLVAVGAVALLAGALTWTRIGRSRLLGYARTALAGVTAVGVASGFAVVVGLYGDDVTTGECTPGYIPCIPIVENITCGELKIAVRVVGEDVYGLDRDGDGVGCESYAN